MFPGFRGYRVTFFFCSAAKLAHLRYAEAVVWRLYRRCVGGWVRVGLGCILGASSNTGGLSANPQGVRGDSFLFSG